jgi:hypothetical protein
MRERLTARAWPVPVLLGLIAVAVTGIAVIGKPWGQAIAGDGYQLYWYGGIFAGGYLIGAQHERVLDWLVRRVWWLLAAGLVLFSTEVTLIELARLRSDALAESLAAGGWASDGLAPAYGPDGAVFAVVEGLDAWAWSLAALGLCARFLNRDGPWLRTLSPAVFPVYVFHFPVVLIGLALLTRVAWPWGMEFLLLAAAVYGFSAVAYLLAKRTGPLIRLVGGRYVAGAAGVSDAPTL